MFFKFDRKSMHTILAMLQLPKKICTKALFAGLWNWIHEFVLKFVFINSSGRCIRCSTVGAALYLLSKCITVVLIHGGLEMLLWNWNHINIPLVFSPSSPWPPGPEAQKCQLMRWSFSESSRATRWRTCKGFQPLQCSSAPPVAVWWCPVSR